MKKTLFSIFFSLALAASLAGCGGAASSTAAARASYSSMDSAPQAYAADAGGTAAEAAGTSDLSDAVQNSADLLPQDGRKIILNATLSIEALDFNATCTALARAAQSCGGYVSSTSIDTPAYEGAYRTAYYQFRIPAEQYSVFLEGAGSAGNLVSKQESTQDVTSAYVDVEARLKSLKLQEERLYAMMEQAGDLETLLAIQNQLTEHGVCPGEPLSGVICRIIDIEALVHHVLAGIGIFSWCSGSPAFLPLSCWSDPGSPEQYARYSQA